MKTASEKLAAAEAVFELAKAQSEAAESIKATAERRLNEAQAVVERERQLKARVL